MVRAVLPLLVILGCLAVAGEVRANYTESRVTSEDARAVVARDGNTVVTHALGVRVLAGALRSLTLVGWDADLRVRPTAAVVSADGRPFSASVARDDKGVVHVTVLEPKGLKRGDYRFEIVYETSLASRVTRDGAFDLVRFTMPALREGTDSARLVLDLPSAPTEPRAAADASDTQDGKDAKDQGTDLATLRRSADRDELELVRPHVAKGEPAVFLARIDPKALSALAAPPPATTTASPPPPARPRGSLTDATLIAASSLALFALALTKGRALAGAVSPRGLVPLPAAVRAALAAGIFGAGVFFETTGSFLAGAALVAAALPLLAWRLAPPVPRTRARASWLVTKPEEAFRALRSPADWLDATTPRGLAVLGSVTAVVAVACALARAAGPAAPYVIAIDALALVPIFFTGTSRQMPPSPEREGAALAPVAQALGRAGALKIAPVACADELRLLACPRLAMSGVAGIEVGVAWQRAGGFSLPSFDVLVRVHDGSFASAKMTAAFPSLRPLPGRKPEERVFRFEPDGPFARDAAGLVVDLAEVLRDRRLVEAPARALERRTPPNARRAQQVAA